MGLDMHLEGEKFYWTDWDNPENNKKEDGFEISSKRLKLGYWRKHPDLHGYIVETFNGGKDNCRDIYLGREALKEIIETLEENNGRFEKVTGFFFGLSEYYYDEDDYPANTIKIFKDALAWLEAEDPKVARSVYYKASW